MGPVNSGQECKSTMRNTKPSNLDPQVNFRQECKSTGLYRERLPPRIWEVFHFIGGRIETTFEFYRWR
jgi:hypothetical protein